MYHIQYLKRKEKKIIKDYRKGEVELLRELCVRYPTYSIKRLSIEMNKDISDVFLMIKYFHLPYQWKLSK